MKILFIVPATFLRYELVDFVKLIMSKNNSYFWDVQNSIALLNLLIKARCMTCFSS